MNLAVAVAEPTSKLEQSKAKRRDAILNAARDLIRAGDGEGLSMRTLAKDADVSLATPYNLFGSKRDVLVALFKREGERFVGMEQTTSAKGTIDRIFGFIDGVFELYRSDPAYFRALLLLMHRSDDAELRQELRRSHIAFLKRLLREGVASGELATDISVGLASRQLHGVNLFFVQEWFCGSISLERARLETEFGFSVILYALAKDHVKEALLVRNASLEAKLE